jgi:hypothetical protein
MPRSILLPLLALNAAFVALLVLVGPTYGWLVMVIIGALVSAANIYAIRATRRMR